MQFDYFIYVFILIAFIYGLYRGIKRELSFLIVFSIAVFVPLYAYDFIKGIIERFVSIESIYNKIHVVTNLFNMSEGCFEFLIVFFVPFIMCNLVLNGILYASIFGTKKARRKEITKLQRFLGGLLGIIVGLELSMVMMILLNGVMEVDLNGFVSTILLKMPKLSDFIALTSQIVSEV